MRGGIPASERGQWRVIGSALLCAPCAEGRRSARRAARVRWLQAFALMLIKTLFIPTRL